VVKDATEVMVKLPTAREFKAHGAGHDPKTDCRRAEDQRQQSAGGPDAARARACAWVEWVLAIGAPFGFENTRDGRRGQCQGPLAAGRQRRALHPDGRGGEPRQLGGPLFNARGEVVGINSQIYSQSGGYQGVSFAIPIDLAAKIKDQIVAHGKVEHAKLGVSVQEVNQTLADSFGLERPEGALVANVEKGSAADRAGLQPGDVIRAANGKTIVASGDLPAIVGLSQPGEKAGAGRVAPGQVREADRRTHPQQRQGAAAAPVPMPRAADRAGPAPLDAQDARKSACAARVWSRTSVGRPKRRAWRRGHRAGRQRAPRVHGGPGPRRGRQVAEVRALLIQRGDEKIFVPIRLG
jgi:serine protease Do